MIYAKAEARVAAMNRAGDEGSLQPLHQMAVRPLWSGDLEDARLEMTLRMVAIPAALLMARLAIAIPMLHALVRIFFSMWVHELGHASTAWLCGFPSFPGPWFTPVSESRSALGSVLLGALTAFLGCRAWMAGKRGWALLAAGLLLLQISLTLGLSQARAQALIIFNGDAGCMVLGSILMASVYARPESQVHTGWLRWGFLVIGAAAFMDAFETWWAARMDVDRIPFGMNEGAGLSDPSRLVEVFGWSENELVRRYVVLGVGSLMALAVVYVLNLLLAREVVRRITAEAGARPAN